MREILFRGKAKDGKWYFGDLVQFKSGLVYIQSKEEGKSNYVLPETVGQFMGLTDKNGKRIFEGDIVTGLFLHSMPVNGIAAFLDGSFGLLWDRAGAETFNAFTSMCNVEYEVIGNIHDNPELIKE